MSLVFDITDLELKAEVAGLLCWLLKDAGWCLLLPGFCIPAALLAIVLEVVNFSLRWRWETAIQRAHTIATILWLSGNTVWMMGELFYSMPVEAGVRLPWHHRPLLDANAGRYAAWVVLARGIFIAALVVLLVHYAAERWNRNGEKSLDPAGPAPGARPLVLGVFSPEAYEGAFIGPWLAKDLCWTFELYWTALPFTLMVLILMLDYCAVANRGLLFAVVELWWVMANFVWMTDELALGDHWKWPRLLAGVILCADSVFAFALFWKAKPDKSRSQAMPLSESSYLFGGGASRHSAN